MLSENHIYDQRQYRTMLQKINSYFMNKIDANAVIIDIDNLLHFLHVKNEDFFSKCKDLLMDIDVGIYYLNEGHLGDEQLMKLDIERINKSMKSMQQLIESKIDKNLTDEDVEYKY
ncbi:MAG: hypothetical protein ABIF12_00595 [bacterium]